MLCNIYKNTWGPTAVKLQHDGHATAKFPNLENLYQPKKNFMISAFGCEPWAMRNWCKKLKKQFLFVLQTYKKRPETLNISTEGTLR